MLGYAPPRPRSAKVRATAPALLVSIGRHALTLALLAWLSLPTHAHAQEPQTSATAALQTPSDASYYYDSSALLAYTGLLGSAALYLWTSPRAEPRLFDAGEGGGEFKGDTLPDWTLAVIGGATLGTAALSPTVGRWYHTKGFVGAYGSTMLMTTLVKNLVGRHRPDYQPGDPEAGGDDGRRSFFSGHSSLTLVSTTYLALYLRTELFPRWRPAGSRLPWWEATAYAGLAAFSAFVPYTRVHDNRHHVSDVIVGSLVGASVATAFFFWQRHRLAQHTSDTGATGRAHLQWSLSPTGMAISGRF